MIPITTNARSVLGRSFKYYVRAESWLNSNGTATLIADNIPVTSGSEEADANSNVPERVTLAVPRKKNGYDWSPTSDDSPLGCNARLRIELGIGYGQNQIEWLQRGWFQIVESEVEGNDVNVEASGLLWLIQEARLINPYQPTGTLMSTLRGLMEPALTVVNRNVGDRSVPSGINYDEDRLDAVYELLDGWPAQGHVNADGYFEISVPTTPSTAQLNLTNGKGGTIIEATGSSTRKDAYNCVVARGTDSAGARVQAVEYDVAGPKRVGGPFNPLPVPFYYASPLLTTVAQCRAAARTVLARKMRQTAEAFSVEMVPDPTIQLGDAVAITTDLYSNLLCTVESIRLPYTPAGGSMTMTVKAV